MGPAEQTFSTAAEKSRFLRTTWFLGRCARFDLFAVIPGGANV
jgi:hypothetical protein